MPRRVEEPRPRLCSLLVVVSEQDQRSPESKQGQGEEDGNVVSIHVGVSEETR
jgi:hypothetical protein